MSGMPDRTDCTLAGNIVHMCCTGCKDPALHMGSVEGDSGVPWRGRMLEEVGLEMGLARRRLGAGEDSRTVERTGN